MRTSRSDQGGDGFNLHAWQFDGETGTLIPANLRTGGVTNIIYIDDGANAINFFNMRSPNPWNMVVPPDNTTLAYKALQMSTTLFMMLWKGLLYR